MPHPQILIIGCGNPLFADDGFGPIVVNRLKRRALPSAVRAIDAGTAAAELIFPFIDPMITRDLIVIDAADFGASPGTVRIIPLEILPEGGIGDTSPGGIAQDLVELSTRIRIIMILCQPGHSSYPQMFLGLSHQVARAVPRAVSAALRLINQIQQGEKNQHQGQEMAFNPDMIHIPGEIPGYDDMQ